MYRGEGFDEGLDGGIIGGENGSRKMRDEK
jgi:hypothetical protein